MYSMSFWRFVMSLRISMIEWNMSFAVSSIICFILLYSTRKIFFWLILYKLILTTNMIFPMRKKTTEEIYNCINTIHRKRTFFKKINLTSLSIRAIKIPDTSIVHYFECILFISCPNFDTLRISHVSAELRKVSHFGSTQCTRV